MGKTGPKRSRVQRDLDRQTVAQLTLKGWSQVQIAQHLEVTHSTVSRDLAVIRKEWKETAIRDFDLDRQQELEKLRLTEKEFWEAWERSQEGKETNSLEKLVSGKDDSEQPLGRVKQLTRSEQRVGDAQFLNGVVKCVELRSKLLGLFPTEKSSSGSAIAFTDNQVSVIASLMKEANND